MYQQRLTVILRYLTRLDITDLARIPTLAIKVLGKSSSVDSHEKAASRPWLFEGKNLDIITRIDGSNSAAVARRNSLIMAPQKSPYSEAMSSILRLKQPGKKTLVAVCCKLHSRNRTSDRFEEIVLEVKRSLITKLDKLPENDGVLNFELGIGILDPENAFRFINPLSRHYAKFEISRNCIGKRHKGTFVRNLKFNFGIEL